MTEELPTGTFIFRGPQLAQKEDGRLVALREHASTLRGRVTEKTRREALAAPIARR